jgi:hypothetical protein
MCWKHTYVDVLGAAQLPEGALEPTGMTIQKQKGARTWARPSKLLLPPLDFWDNVVYEVR